MAVDFLDLGLSLASGRTRVEGGPYWALRGVTGRGWTYAQPKEISSSCTCTGPRALRGRANFALANSGFSARQGLEPSRAPGRCPVGISVRSSSVSATPSVLEVRSDTIHTLKKSSLKNSRPSARGFCVANLLLFSQLGPARRYPVPEHRHALHPRPMAPRRGHLGEAHVVGQVGVWPRNGEPISGEGSLHRGRELGASPRVGSGPHPARRRRRPAPGCPQRCFP